MLPRILTALVLGGSALVLLAFGWPQLFGLQNSWVFAHAVSLRGLGVAVAAAGTVVLVLLTPIRPLRRLAGSLAVLLLLFGLGNAAVLAARGIGVQPASAAERPTASAAANGDVTVLSWNTLGDEPGSAAIARLALDRGADIVSLPETTEATGVKVAEAMREAGRPMWVHTVAFDQISKARSTTLLISPDLGDYTVSSAAGSGPPGNTNVLPTVVATPVDGTGPTIVAVHAVAPINWEMSNWRSDLDWLATQCGGGNLIMAGDFNSTIDHMSGRESSGAAVLGTCRDSALATGSAAVGTWPTSVSPLLGSPIDHVLSTPNWQTDSMSVIESEDAAGSDHRPIVATLSLR
ncbi:endonuclease/exonuclease/phosphatase family protein [Cryobacterium fucosi]|uniref:Endonuclease/exonuclease/phosphatase family protein n=1 Tax=Cryobacterium fucosi TaxID=1259157 RepID=A0A4R9BBH3_9MICO|nr:endonuclease/exonuclease/phosphatase family protein [Cryobacterium fucosi]TFD80242.1 endonuclease/exonuclease/phosphatase family protein [Cryobacterium fucosi]